MKAAGSLCAVPFALAVAAAHAGTYTCVSFEQPPLAYTGPDGQPRGLAVAIAGRLFTRMGHAMRVEMYPWKRALAMASAGQADCVLGLLRTAERMRHLDYSALPLYRHTIYFYARKGVAAGFDGSFSSLKGFHVGTVRGISYGPRFEGAREQLYIDESPTPEHNFMKLAHGRIDFLPSSADAATALLQKSPMRDHAHRIARQPVPVDSVASYIAFPKSRGLEGLKAGFDLLQKHFMASDEYAALLAAYGLEAAPPDPE